MSNKDIARSLASMINEWAEGGIKNGVFKLDGKPLDLQLESIIEKRLNRFSNHPPGLLETQEPKYGILNNRLYVRHSMGFIPEEEPVFIFRAKDQLSVVALRGYLHNFNPGTEHYEAIAKRIQDFEDFAKTYPGRMKMPDTNTLTDDPLKASMEIRVDGDALDREITNRIVMQQFDKRIEDVERATDSVIGGPDARYNGIVSIFSEIAQLAIDELVKRTDIVIKRDPKPTLDDVMKLFAHSGTTSRITSLNNEQLVEVHDEKPKSFVKVYDKPLRGTGSPIYQIDELSYQPDPIIKISSDLISERVNRLIVDRGTGLSYEGLVKLQETFQEDVTSIVRDVYKTGITELSRIVRPREISIDDDPVALTTLQLSLHEMQIETLNMKLAACTTAALSNTDESVKQRLTRDHPYWSVTYQDICNAVDREMTYRQGKQNEGKTT